MPRKSAQQLFSYNVRLLIAQRKLTQGEFAESVGLARPSFNRILAGKERVTLDRAERIAKALGLPLVVLITAQISLPGVTPDRRRRRGTHDSSKSSP